MDEEKQNIREVLSKMNSSERNSLLESLLGSALQHNSESNTDLHQIRVPNKNGQDLVFNIREVKITDANGQIGSQSTSTVWDCGHPTESYQFGGVDDFDHLVCVHCLRWCDIGSHPCCVRDSKLRSDGQRACFQHRGFRRFLRNKFKREI
jgi:hypothetical protein